jgi:hypothetical protein
MSREEIMFEIQTQMGVAVEKILTKLLPGKSGEKHSGPSSGGFEYDQKQANGPGKAKAKGTGNS